MKQPRKVCVEIHDPQSLAEAGDLLHDAVFSLEDTAYDRKSGVFQMLAWREANELPGMPHRGLFGMLLYTRYPQAPCVWRLRFVQDMIVEEPYPELGPYYDIGEIWYDPKRRSVRLSGGVPLRIELKAARLCGELTDIGDPTFDAPKWAREPA